MRRRILFAIVGVTALATAVLTVPLAIVSAVRERDIGVHELERAAELVAAGIDPGALRQGGQIDLPHVAKPLNVAVYDTEGNRLVGDGPRRAGRLVSETQRLTRQGVIRSRLVVTSPIIVDGQKLGVIRISEPFAETAALVRRDMFLLIGFDVVAIGIAAAVGWFVSARLVKPVELIRDDAIQLGGGDFSIGQRVSGIAELDATSAALSNTADRLDHTLQRERNFSANASHQLRTPLTALRLGVEGELLSPRSDHALVLHEALNEIDRLESTIAIMLNVARMRSGAHVNVDLSGWAEEVRTRWLPRIVHAGRFADFATHQSEVVDVNRGVLDEICDVLIHNALVHGEGHITVRADETSGSLSVSVADRGKLDRDPLELFVRHDPHASGSGVGLSLARSLAEGEGGQLVVASVEPTEFRLVLPGELGRSVHP